MAGLQEELANPSFNTTGGAGHTAPIGGVATSEAPQTSLQPEAQEVQGAPAPPQSSPAVDPMRGLLLYEALRLVAGNPYGRDVAGMIHNELSMDEAKKLKEEERKLKLLDEDRSEKQFRERQKWLQGVADKDFERKNKRELMEIHYKAVAGNIYTDDQVAEAVEEALLSGQGYGAALVAAKKKTGKNPLKPETFKPTLVPDNQGNVFAVVSNKDGSFKVESIGVQKETKGKTQNTATGWSSR